MSTDLQSRHPGLVWSTSNADATALLRAALLRPRFHQLLDFAVHLGLETVIQEWELLQAAQPADARRSQAAVERIVANIRKGRDLAAGND